MSANYFLPLFRRIVYNLLDNYADSLLELFNPMIILFEYSNLLFMHLIILLFKKEIIHLNIFY